MKTKANKTTKEQVQRFSDKACAEAGYDFGCASEHKAKFLVSVLENTIAEILDKYNLSIDSNGNTKTESNE